MIKKIVRKPKSAYRMIRKDGFIIFQIRMLERLYRHLNAGKAVKLHSFAKIEDIMNADWSKVDQSLINPKIKKQASYKINWVMSPPGKGSGGHQNLLRFIDFLEKAGHKNNIYFYSTIDHRSLKQIKEVMEDKSFPNIKAPMQWLKGEMSDADAIFATGWETAYPVFNSKIKAKRFYFVQDFEPFFYPVGTEYVLAENTYRFGFHGITAGGWLAKKLHQKYGMQTDYYDFGADKELYKITNKKPRKEIFFYARPVTARRAFELGIMALTKFHYKHPDVIINLAGWDVKEYEIPFPYNNLATLPLEKLSEVYNRCAVALVMSLTNMSLLPLELLACGTIPVVNDGENNRLVSSNKFIAYAPNNPSALANKLCEIYEMSKLEEYSYKASESVASSDWKVSGDKFVKIFEKEIING